MKNHCLFIEFGNNILSKEILSLDKKKTICKYVDILFQKF